MLKIFRNINQNLNLILKLNKLKIQNNRTCKLLNNIELKFSTSSKYSQKHPGVQALKKQKWYDQYITGTTQFNQKNYLSALQSYYKVIQTMQSSNQKGQAYYYKVYQKILQLNYLLNRPLQTEQNLYKIIKTRKQLTKNPILVYEDYHDLMIHQIQHNVQKAIKLGKALLSQSQINNLPINIQKKIRMLLGNGYLLVGNYPDAKKKYGQVLQMKPTNNIKAMTLNNLSIACWWHKNPLFKNSLPENDQIIYEQARINRDFKQTKQLLMNSIGSLQNIQQLEQNDGQNLQNLLNQITQNLILSSSSSKQSLNNGQYSFKQKNSLKAISNIIQYYIYNDPIQKPLILAWMRILIKNGARFGMSLQKYQIANYVDEITAKYYLLNGDLKNLKQFLLNNLINKQALIDSLNNTKALKNIFEKNKNEINNYLQLIKMLNVVKQVPVALQNQDKNKNIKNQLLQKLKKSNLKVLINQFQTQINQKDPYYFKRQFLISQEPSFLNNYYSKIGSKIQQIQ